MIINNIFKKRQMFITYPIQQLIEMHKNGRLELRETNQLQVRKIKKYLMSNAASKEIYFPPMVAAIKAADYEGQKQKPAEIRLADGSHRMKAFIQLEDQIFNCLKSSNDDEIRNAYHLQYMLESTEIAVQLIEGLTKEEEDQLYIDLNTKGKEVALSKRIEYDSRNSLNQITNSLLKTNAKLRRAGVETEKRAIIRPANKKLVSLSQLRLIAGTFISGRVITRPELGNTNQTLNEQEYIELINLWFDKLFASYPPERIGNYQESMLAGFPLLLSMAVYASKGLAAEPFSNRKSEMDRRMNVLANVDWSRQNPVWRQFDGSIKGPDKYFYLANHKKNIELLVHWLEQQGR